MTRDHRDVLNTLRFKVKDEVPGTECLFVRKFCRVMLCRPEVEEYGAGTCVRSLSWKK